MSLLFDDDGASDCNFFFLFENRVVLIAGTECVGRGILISAAELVS